MDPMFQHDCIQCLWVGKTGTHDLYVCSKATYNQTTGPTLIARFGNLPHDYTSMPWSALMATPRELQDPRLVAAADAVIIRINQEKAPALHIAMEGFIRCHGTPSLLATVSGTATRILHEGNAELLWGKILDTLHFEAVLDRTTGDVILNVVGGNGASG